MKMFILLTLLIVFSLKAQAQTDIIRREQTETNNHNNQLRQRRETEKRAEQEKERIEAEQRSKALEKIKYEKAVKDSIAWAEKRNVECGKLLLLKESDRSFGSDIIKKYNVSIGTFTLKIDTVEMYVADYTDDSIEKKVIIPEKVKIGNMIYPVKLQGGGGAYRGKLSSLIIPPSIKEIPKAAFCNSTNLTKVLFPATIELIDKEAFTGCEKLDSIKLLEPLKYIGDEAFYGCNSLKDVQLPSSLFEIGERAFAKCNSLESIEIWDSVREIGSNAFSECKNLNRVTMRASSKKLIETFSGCGNLENVVLSGQMGKLYRTFSGCNKLKQITFSGDVQEIGKETFVNCRNLTSIEIPCSVFSIGYHAFAWCKSLTSLTVHAGIRVRSNSFVGCDNLKTIIVINPDGSRKEISAAKTKFKDTKNDKQVIIE